jgi:hypothetical protein
VEWIKLAKGMQRDHQPQYITITSLMMVIWRLGTNYLVFYPQEKVGIGIREYQP